MLYAVFDNFSCFAIKSHELRFKCCHTTIIHKPQLPRCSGEVEILRVEVPKVQSDEASNGRGKGRAQAKGKHVQVYNSRTGRDTRCGWDTNGATATRTSNERLRKVTAKGSAKGRPAISPRRAKQKRSHSAKAQSGEEKGTSSAE